jgi:hypothetical protein
MELILAVVACMDLAVAVQLPRNTTKIYKDLGV